MDDEMLMLPEFCWSSSTHRIHSQMETCASPQRRTEMALTEIALRGMTMQLFEVQCSGHQHALRMRRHALVSDFVQKPLISLREVAPVFQTQVHRLMVDWFNFRFPHKRHTVSVDELSLNTSCKRRVAEKDAVTVKFPELDLCLRQLPWGFESSPIVWKPLRSRRKRPIKRVPWRY